MKRVIFPIGILAGCILVAAVLLRSPTVVDEAAPEIIPVSVRVAQVRAESIQLNVESQGKVQASQVASLSAPVAGPVAWISSAMEAGGFVKEGESLLRLESSDYETARARSLAAMQQAQAESTHASNELDRLRELADKRLASDSQLQDAIRMANVNIARLADAQASFQQQSSILIGQTFGRHSMPSFSREMSSWVNTSIERRVLQYCSARQRLRFGCHSLSGN